MMHESLPSPTSENKLPTADEVRESLDTLAVFDQWMDEQLELLVAEWIHTAAPNAQRPSKRGFSSR
jgi:hypothetical protein